MIIHIEVLTNDRHEIVTFEEKIEETDAYGIFNKIKENAFDIGAKVFAIRERIDSFLFKDDGSTREEGDRKEGKV